MKSVPPSTVALYCRVSTEDQAERQTIQTQLAFLREYCRLYGLEIVGEYLDEGMSGACPLADRPAGGLAAVLALARAVRPRQWVKNLLVLAAPAAAGTLPRPAVAAGAALAVLGAVAGRDARGRAATIGAGVMEIAAALTTKTSPPKRRRLPWR